MANRQKTDQTRAGKRRPYQFMTKFIIRNGDGDPYLIRWRIFQTPACSLFLHKILRGDSDPYVHDHPWTFLSIVLRGGYVEVRRNNHTHALERRYVYRWNFMRRDDAHYIERLTAVPTWTLLFVGRRRRTWGFWVPQGVPYDNPKAIQNQMWVEFDNWEGR